VVAQTAEGVEALRCGTGPQALVFDHLPPGLPRVVSIGRLDLNSEGLLLLTNDGELARAFERPQNQIARLYRARAHGRATQAALDKLKDGLTVDGVRYGPITARLDTDGAGGANQWITLELHEGKNREVRKVLDAIGLKVNRLIRLAYGPFELGELRPGEAMEVAPRLLREGFAGLIGAERLAADDRPIGQVLKAKPPVRRATAPPAPAPAKPAYKAGWARPKGAKSRGSKAEGSKVQTAELKVSGSKAARPKTERPKTERPKTERPRAMKSATPKPHGAKPGAGGRANAAARPHPARPKTARPPRTKR